MIHEVIEELLLIGIFVGGVGLAAGIGIGGIFCNQIRWKLLDTIYQERDELNAKIEKLSRKIRKFKNSRECNIPK